MKRFVWILAIGIAFTFLGGAVARAGEMDVLVNKLVEKGVLTPVEGQIILDEARQEMAKEVAEAKAVTAPEWTQKVKFKGDVRFRTQVDWGKSDGTAFANANYRLRERIRARLAVEGKVNEQVSAGIRIVTGDSDHGNSTNQTLDAAYEHLDDWIDLAYIRWQPDFEMLNESTVWAGMFENPFVNTELTWDGDINPKGVAFQYMSPTFMQEQLPSNLFFNTGMLWMGEGRTWMADPMLWIWQGGVKTLVCEDWDMVFTGAVAYYNYANIQDRNLQDSPGTNTVWLAGNAPSRAVVGTTRYDYDVLDVVAMIDSKKFFEYEFPYGLYSEMIWNPGADDKNWGFLAGGYLGNKKPSNQGDWKFWTDFRYTQRDAIPDIQPDSDFFGFQTNGTPRGGGTNGWGFNTGFQYALLKNTVLNIEYYWCKAIQEDVIAATEFTAPYQLLQVDIQTKF